MSPPVRYRFIGQAASAAFVAGSQTGKFGHELGVPYGKRCQRSGKSTLVPGLECAIDFDAGDGPSHVIGVKCVARLDPHGLAGLVEQLGPEGDIVARSAVINFYALRTSELNHTS
eukprot:COSAG01_NODE_2159_length_8277_cov_416.997065_10_plen_115_part_00